MLFSNTEVRKSTCQKAPVGAPHTSNVYIYKKKKKDLSEMVIERGAARDSKKSKAEVLV